MNILKSSLVTTIALGLLLVSTTPIQAEPTNPPPAKSEKPKTPHLLTPAEAEKLIADKDKKVVVLDVRTPEEFAAGHIAGATNIDFNADDFQKKLEQLPKDQTYLVNCAIGGRSAKACKLMNQLDFKSVYNLKGGMNAWEDAGKPVTK
jgi:rhodanese-related sulfurtransferase